MLVFPFGIFHVSYLLFKEPYLLGVKFLLLYLHTEIVISLFQLTHQISYLCIHLRLVSLIVSHCLVKTITLLLLIMLQFIKLLDLSL